jgi:hypothetical protein
MLHLILALTLLQQTENLRDSVHKYEKLWKLSIDTVVIISKEFNKNKTRDPNFKNKINEYMDKNVYYYNKYFEFKEKLKAEEEAKKYITKL